MSKHFGLFQRKTICELYLILLLDDEQNILYISTWSWISKSWILQKWCNKLTTIRNRIITNSFIKAFILYVVCTGCLCTICKQTIFILSQCCSNINTISYCDRSWRYSCISEENGWELQESLKGMFLERSLVFGTRMLHPQTPRHKSENTINVWVKTFRNYFFKLF